MSHPESAQGSGRYVGRAVARREDLALLTGAATFLADLSFPGMVHAVFVRSTSAHARIVAVDTDAARGAPGVVAVFTAQDFKSRVQPLSKKFYPLEEAFVASINAVEGGYREPILAEDRVTRVGEAVAIVVATSRVAAEDARDLVEIDYDELPAMLDPEAALAPGCLVIHPDMETNVHSRFVVEVGECPDPTRGRMITRKFRFGRSVGCPMENRGVLATTDIDGTLTVWSTTQVPFVLRTHIAASLGLVEDDITVKVPHMGGSFGGGVYAEEIAIAHVARELGRPVQWLEERSESLTNSRHSRDHHVAATLQVDDDGKMLGLDVRVVQDTGCHNPFGLTLVHNVATHVRSVYLVPRLAFEGVCVLTNKTRITPVRGAGRPEATFIIDRMIDIAARELGMDPAEMRRRNLVPGDEMPHRLGMLYRDGSDAVYDSGDFPGQFERLLEVADYEGWKRRRDKGQQDGLRLGIGLSCHVEATGIGAFEGIRLEVEKSGNVTVYSGAVPHGQSHHTMLAQVVADELGVDIDTVHVRTGSTDLLPHGLGTFGSRTGVAGSAAASLACGSLRRILVAAAADLFEADPGDVEWAQGRARVRGGGERASVDLQGLAAAVAPGKSRQLGGGHPYHLVATEYYIPPTVTFGSGSHCAVVEVNPALGVVRIVDYVSVDDCGRRLNPTVVEGQVIGGLAHGISNALFEEVVYDESGQMSNASLADYLIASSAEVPRVRCEHIDHESTTNPYGVKGVGEGSTSSAPAAIANAISDALSVRNVEVNSLPFRPWDYLDKLLEDQSSITGGK